jgi:hypothetical protein
MPFRVYADGSAVIQKATLQSGTTGRRIIIDSATGVLKMINANNVEVITLSDQLSEGVIQPYLKMTAPDINKTMTLASYGLDGYDDVGGKIYRTGLFNYGFATSIDSGAIFAATVSYSSPFYRLSVIMKGLIKTDTPANEASLVSGSVYVDSSNFLKIKL